MIWGWSSQNAKASSIFRPFAMIDVVSNQKWQIIIEDWQVCKEKVGRTPVLIVEVLNRCARGCHQFLNFGVAKWFFCQGKCEKRLRNTALPYGFLSDTTLWKIGLKLVSLHKNVFNEILNDGNVFTSSTLIPSHFCVLKMERFV
jgi:hypothetical protein